MHILFVCTRCVYRRFILRCTAKQNSVITIADAIFAGYAMLGMIAMLKY
ncbi:hypothetical protein EC843_108137 [Buttiauxella sp. JUb87]|nr:hypothetical protein EC843_108137 [Buttiauxella sp. JUb87]